MKESFIVVDEGAESFGVGMNKFEEIKATRDGLDVLPVADPAVRAALDARAAAQGWPALHAELARVDAAITSRTAAGATVAADVRYVNGIKIDGRLLAEAFNMVGPELIARIGREKVERVSMSSPFSGLRATVPRCVCHRCRRVSSVA